MVQAIMEKRELRPHEEADLRLICRLADKRGWVTRFEILYLDIVGVPYNGYLKKPTPGKPKRAPKGVDQGSLF